ncbi:MAG: acetyltransferase [Candidatus Aenigmarchaeota archaeon]|nr:acetyltransferase [Candidatus Aenigmarchaeota archaeon]
MIEVNSPRKGVSTTARIILLFFEGYELIKQKARYLLLKRVFKKCGRNVIIRKNVWFVYPEYIEVGDNVSINNSCFFEGGSGIKIGNCVRMAHCVSIISRNHSFAKRDIPIVEQEFTGAVVSIGDDVWLGAKVTVLPGVSIGKGSVIGANSVVTHDIPPYSVAVGSPAKVIKKR